MTRLISPLAILCCFLTSSLFSAEPDLFETKIRPILINRCAECHGEDLQEGGLRIDSSEGFNTGGESGQIVVPGKPNESRLIQVVRYNADLKMPPKSKIPDTEIADLIRWVEAGATWPNATPTPNSPKPLPPKKQHPSAEGMEFSPEQKSFWSFQKMIDPAPPEVKLSTWPQTPIDQFILHKLEAAELSPAPPVERHLLIRRVTLDLTGLPPTPEEVANFINDTDANAFAKVVDRLLASPQYGERWGRHWLDLARYADSNGLDENLAYANAFRYRDYVINSFNQDKPYDEFVREQLAGDLLPPSDNLELNQQRIVATGFLSLGGKMLAEDDPVKMKMDIIDEQVDTIGRTLLGLTFGCARCHDHKYDPISMADYYGIAGILHSTKTMENFNVVAKWREQPIAPPDLLQKYQQISADLESRQKARETLLATANPQITANCRLHAADYLVAGTIHWKLRQIQSQLTPLGGTNHQLPADQVINLEAENFTTGNVITHSTGYGQGIGVILNGGTLPNFAEYEINTTTSNLHRIEIRYAAHEARPVRVLLDGQLIRPDAAHQTTGSWGPEGQIWEIVSLLSLQPGKHLLRLERDGPFPHIDRLFIAPASLPPLEKRILDALVPRETSENPDLKTVPLAPVFIQQWSAYLEKTATDPLSPLAPWHNLIHSTRPASAHLILNLEQELSRLAEQYRTQFAETDKLWQETLAANKDAGGLSSPDREELRSLLYSKEGPCALPPPAEIPYPLETKNQLAELDNQIRDLEKQRPDLPSTMAVTEAEPANIKIHLRGNHLTLGPEVPRRFPRIFSAPPDLVIEKTSGRLELAHWITQPDHPLTARVIVNRVWGHHFGKGIVRSTDNFGLLGERPSHPELLDWLAQRFIESGWSLKSLHRLILLSATYQQAGTKSSAVDTIDPENRLLSHFSRQRMDAESIRDSILALCGSLDHTQYGSLLPTPNRQYVTSTASVNPVVYKTNRRSIYLPVVRSALYEVLQAFDFADPSTPNGQRDTTTVAPQALFLMNSDFVSLQTQTLARSLITQDSLSTAERINTLYQKFFARSPNKAETERAEKYLEQFTTAAKTRNFHPDEASLYAWQSLCRALLSTNEFLFIE